MRFVYGDKVDVCATEGGHESTIAEAFGGDIEKLEAAGLRFGHDLRLVLARNRGVDGGSGHAGSAEGIDLVLHQREEGRDDERDAGPGDESGHLVADALAAAGRQDGERVLPIEDGRDDFGLAGAELLVAEGFAENRSGALKGGGWHHRC